MISRVAVLATLIVVSVAEVGRADAGHTAYALVVTNNHAGALGRPDLQYADDDGARYYELFVTLAPSSHVTLLTEFDRDTAQLFPALVPLASAPSRAHVAAAARAIAARVAAAEHAGDTADFYFVFAGHGDVDRGRGFLQLTDGTFDSGDLEALVASIHATHTHVILDSCNSFFVVTPRRPGGRRFATPADAAAGLAQRVPNVGVFVSTSAEAEVYEWSSLQSGVFSHAVRSGLAGAADANHDGVISYDELRAFVDTATAEIKNSAFRPKVYARGPGGDDRAALVTPAPGGRRLALDTARPIRLTIRDRDELPWLDLNKEAGAAVTLRLPTAAASADERDERGAVQRRALDPAAMTAAGSAALDDLRPADEPPASRTTDEPFHGLFARPFGPAALARYDAERADAPPPVFGISRDDARRLAELLGEADDDQREQRRINAGVELAVGVLGLAGAVDSWTAHARAASIGLEVTAGAAAVAAGVVEWVRRPESEQLREALGSGLASGREPARVVAEADSRLHAAARAAHTTRMVERWAGAAILALSVSVGVSDLALDRRWSTGNRAFDPAVALIAIVGGLSLSTSFRETPIERTTRLWDHEPTVAAAPKLVISPVVGGAALSLGGGF